MKLTFEEMVHIPEFTYIDFKFAPESYKLEKQLTKEEKSYFLNKYDNINFMDSYNIYAPEKKFTWLIFKVEEEEC